MSSTDEQKRLEEARKGEAAWKKWGRTSVNGSGGPCARTTARGRRLEFLHPRSCPLARLPMGRDGLAGLSDDKQRLCFALALWNGKDPILKERLFGLTNSEGNHGEDVKEYYFYLDSTPTHSYMKYLYKYPQAAFPYADLAETNRRSHAQRDGVRTPRHRRIQRRPILRRLRRVCQSRPGRHPGPDHRGQPGTGRGGTASPADALVPERLAPWIADVTEPPKNRTSNRSGRRRARAPVAVTHRCWGVHPLLRRRCSVALHR